MTDAGDDFFFRPLGRQTSAGIKVDRFTALRAPVVLDCLTVLSQTIAMLPIQVFERLPNGDKRPAPTHPLLQVFDNVGGHMSRYEFVAQLVFDLASAGNAYYRIEPGTGQFGRVGTLVRCEPEQALVERLQDNSVRYTFTDFNGRTTRALEDEVWHLRDVPVIDGLTGLSRVHAGAEAIGALLALQDYGAAYFENDATPPVMIKHPGYFKDDASRDNFLNAVKTWFGRKRRSPAVLEHGMDVTRLGTTPEEAQFLETRKELQQEIARIWRMPPHKVGIMENATFSNIEHQALEFVTDTLTPWIELIEGAVRRTLLLNPQRFVFEFNVAGLLRGDIKARFEAYATARQWGWLSVNEIRRLENMNPVGARGDQYLQPMNMEPAGMSEPRVLDGAGRTASQWVGGEWARVQHGA